MVFNELRELPQSLTNRRGRDLVPEWRPGEATKPVAGGLPLRWDGYGVDPHDDDAPQRVHAKIPPQDAHQRASKSLDGLAAWSGTNKSRLRTTLRTSQPSMGGGYRSTAKFVLSTAFHSSGMPWAHGLSLLLSPRHCCI
ncbi:hypothetical protein J3E69DRAFT_147440 [Trichoderma sp. SZMC 28015]